MNEIARLRVLPVMPTFPQGDDWADTDLRSENVKPGLTRLPYRLVGRHR